LLIHVEELLDRERAGVRSGVRVPPVGNLVCINEARKLGTLLQVRYRLRALLRCPPVASAARLQPSLEIAKRSDLGSASSDGRLFTNYVGISTKPNIDFPLVEPWLDEAA
jgi:hypothetical protein